MKHVLIYLGNETKKKAVLEEICNNLQLPHTFLEDKDLSQSIGYLFQIKGYHKNNSNDDCHIAEDLMIFKEVEDEDIHKLNAFLKEKNTLMERKAMLTEHNQNWLLKDLLAEIIEEHAFFKHREELKKLLIEASQLKKESYPVQIWKAFEKSYQNAYISYMEEKNPDKLIKSLQDFKKGLLNMKK